MAGILAGLIPNSTEAIEPYGKNPNPSIERVTQSKSGPGARARAKTQPGVADAFVPQRNYWPYQKPLSAKRPGRIQKGPFDLDQEQGKSTCKSEVQETKTYNIKSQIDNHKKLIKISNKIRKNPKLVQEFNGLEQKLRNGNMGVKFLPNSNGIYYARG